MTVSPNSRFEHDFGENISVISFEVRINSQISLGEQTFYRDKGLKNPPKRCKECKQAKNERLAAIAAAQAAGIKQRIEVAVHCARCNSQTTVPFYPSQGRPVYCRSCFLEMNPNLIKDVKS